LHANKRDAEKNVSFFCALATEISEESPKIEMANGNKTVKVSGIKSTTINRTALCKQVFLLAALDTNEEFTSALDVANYNARILDAEGLLCGYNKVCFAGYRNVIPLCGLHVVSLILKKHLTVKDMNRAIYETTAMLRASGNFTEDICSWNYQPGVINSRMDAKSIRAKLMMSIYVPAVVGTRGDVDTSRNGTAKPCLSSHGINIVQCFTQTFSSNYDTCIATMASII
jgi:hypothetical protein